MRILYIDPITGLSGDMLASAIVHLGFPRKRVDDIVSRIRYIPLKVEFEEIRESVLSGLRMRGANLHHTISVHEMRMLANEIPYEKKVKDDINRMLDILLEMESRIHRSQSEEIKLHELSSIDTILDLAIFAHGISYFNVEKIYCGPIPHGAGLIETAHGRIPNPPPLTLELVRGYKCRFYDSSYELTTPTGALIVRYYVKPDERVPPFKILNVGYGFGSYKMEEPDALRVILGEVESTKTEEINVLEFDVDDMDMEYTGFFADSLRKAGAKDVTYHPVCMKKGRIGIRFSVLCDDDNLEGIKSSVFRETSTFGLRQRKEKREILKREERLIKTPYGDVRVKLGFDRDGKLLKEHVEFDDVVRISESSGIPYPQVLKEVRRRLWDELTKGES